MGNGPVAADELRLLIERVERLEEEKKGIADDIKDVYGEAKSRGFCTKTIKTIVALRKLDPDDRRNREAMLDLYKGALGMLDGTPLGNWAVERLKKDETARKADATMPPAEPVPDGPSEAAEPEDPVAPEPVMSIDDARRLGAEAARDGKAVTANPFPARDARRAAWDEAWCHELGTDGMDIPAALRPAAKKPKGDEAAAAPDPVPADAAAPNSSEKAEHGTAADEPPAPQPDAVYADARAAVLREQYASVSKIQKWLTIGYNRAAAIMERLQRDGVVSPAAPDGKRDVLLDSEGRPK